jgi:flagellar basal body P-ring protein FlgI
VRIALPLADRADPAGFIADVQSIEIDPSLLREVARVVIDRTAGTIVATSTVTVQPVAVALPEAGLRFDPAVDLPGPWRAVDGTGGEGRASTRLNDLLARLDQIRVPVEQQIDLIHSLARAGAMTAEIVEQ